MARSWYQPIRSTSCAATISSSGSISAASSEAGSISENGCRSGAFELKGIRRKRHGRIGKPGQFLLAGILPAAQRLDPRPDRWLVSTALLAGPCLRSYPPAGIVVGYAPV